MKRGRCWFCKRWRPTRKLWRGGNDHPDMECRMPCRAGHRGKRRWLSALGPGSVMRVTLRRAIGAPKWRGVYR